jgi:ATP/ADP translocase
MKLKKLEKILAQKRRQSAYKLVLPVIGEFLIMAAPKPTAEVPSEALISVAELAIFFDIWKLYFEEEIEESKLRTLLEEMGMMTLLGSIATFLTAKLTNALAAEVGNFIPGVGWLVGGLIASIITLISGILWINFCETVYRKKVQDSSVSVV